jgi:hypothetical protein
MGVRRLTLLTVQNRGDKDNTLMMEAKKEHSELVKRALAIVRNHPTPLTTAVIEKPDGNLQDAVKETFSVNKPIQLELIVEQVSPCPSGPLMVASDFAMFGRPDDLQAGSTVAAPYVTILDPAKFVSATLADLASYVSAKNQGRQHSWIEDIVDEKIEQLRLCGVEAEIRTVQ